MAYQPDWIAKHFVIPRSDLTFISGDEYLLDMAEFHKEVRRLEWAFGEGLEYVDVIEYVAPISVGGTDLAPVVSVVNDYTFEFEEFVNPYIVNIEGANSNLADVTVVNNVSVRPKNSAGLIIKNSECSNIAGDGINQEVSIMYADESIYVSSVGESAIMLDDPNYLVKGEAQSYVSVYEQANSVRMCNQ